MPVWSAMRTSIFSSGSEWLNKQRPIHSSKQNNKIERIRAAHGIMAKLVIQNPVYIPIFERLERELAVAEADGDIITRARNIVAQRATR